MSYKVVISAPLCMPHWTVFSQPGFKPANCIHSKTTIQIRRHAASIHNVWLLVHFSSVFGQPTMYGKGMLVKNDRQTHHMAPALSVPQLVIQTDVYTAPMSRQIEFHTSF